MDGKTDKTTLKRALSLSLSFSSSFDEKMAITLSPASSLNISSSYQLMSSYQSAPSLTFNSDVKAQSASTFWEIIGEYLKNNKQVYFAGDLIIGDKRYKAPITIYPQDTMDIMQTWFQVES